jgi:SET domain-containing protein
MKKFLLATLLLFSTQAFAELKDFDFYMSKSCEEMTDINSGDQFIQFAAKEIKEDLGENFCSKVTSSESEFNELTDPNERSFNESKVSPVEYGRLIDSLYQYYESIN